MSRRKMRREQDLQKRERRALASSVDSTRADAMALSGSPRTHPDPAETPETPSSDSGVGVEFRDRVGHAGVRPSGMRRRTPPSERLVAGDESEFLPTLADGRPVAGMFSMADCPGGRGPRAVHFAPGKPLSPIIPSPMSPDVRCAADGALDRGADSRAVIPRASASADSRMWTPGCGLPAWDHPPWPAAARCRASSGSFRAHLSRS